LPRDRLAQQALGVRPGRHGAGHLQARAGRRGDGLTGPVRQDTASIRGTMRPSRLAADARGAHWVDVARRVMSQWKWRSGLCSSKPLCRRSMAISRRRPGFSGSRHAAYTIRFTNTNCSVNNGLPEPDICRRRSMACSRMQKNFPESASPDQKTLSDWHGIGR
jgi:hypothetical protein